MKAVIMAGGFGTRIQPLTINLPKPMIPLINRPIVITSYSIHYTKLYDGIARPRQGTDEAVRASRQNTDFQKPLHYTWFHQRPPA